MISHRYKLVYVHINKTGGTSIESLLTGQPNDQVTALEIKQKLNDDSLWNQFFKFSVVRNPWDRMVSEYHFRKTSHLIQPHKWHCPVHLRIPPNLSFKEWILQSHNEAFSEVIRFRSQINWLLDTRGNLMVNFICRFENLSTDFNTVCDILGQSWTLPQHNKTDHEHYSYYYDEETRKVVADRHKEDLNFFKYKFTNA